VYIELLGVIWARSVEYLEPYNASAWPQAARRNFRSDLRDSWRISASGVCRGWWSD
jgi:hypothetical protein